jgi:ABC-type dipeptide/oligopeptide/nickel transport system permease subunit
MILGETGAVVPRHRAAAADHELGRAPERGAEHQRGRALPWLMAPVLPVIIVILAFNFFGDGLRDAADPYR